MQSLTPSLDTRRLAMLKAMGVELWWAKAAKAADAAAPNAANIAAPIAASSAAPSAAAEAMAERRASSAAVLTRPQAPAAHAAQDSPPVVAAPPAPQLHRAPMADPKEQAPEQAAAASRASLSSPAVVWSMPTVWHAPQAADTPASDASAAPRLLLLVDDLQVLGDAQAAAMQLLENMVRAMGLANSPALWLSWAKRTPSPTEPAAAASLAAQPVATVEDMLAQTAADAVLVMGREAAQQWLGRTEPLGALRQDTHSAHGLPVVVTYSPAYLLRATHAKRQAWADLQRMMALLAEARRS